MPVYKSQSNLFGGTFNGAYRAPNGASKNGRINRVVGTVVSAIDAQAGSTFKLATIPASAIMLPESRIKTTAWGFAQAVVGTTGATDTLLDVLKATGGAAGNAPVVMFDAKWNRPLWQQLGLAKDPGKPIDLIVIAEADATVAGQLDFDLQFANHI